MSQGVLFAFGAGVFFIGGAGMVLIGLSMFKDWESRSELEAAIQDGSIESAREASQSSRATNIDIAARRSAILISPRERT